MIGTILLMIYNICRIALNKIPRPTRFRVQWVQRISPLCAMKTFGHGTFVIGHNCEFAAYCDFEVHGQGIIEIGERTYFNRYCMLSAHESIKVGEGCMFGPGVKIFDNNHRYDSLCGVSCELNTAPISIGDHTWVGANVVILKGTKIGRNCVIGAGCVVRGNVPDGSVLVNKQYQELR